VPSEVDATSANTQTTIVIEPGAGMTPASSGATAIEGSQEDRPRVIARCRRVVHCGVVRSCAFGSNDQNLWMSLGEAA
jgi:hypothetical protein